jgi:predicted membrane protein
LKGKFSLGIMFILIGIVAIFNQLGFWDIGNIISIWWPMILIGVGINQLSSRPVSKTSGIVLLLLGVVFQMRELDIITVSLRRFFWPAIIIAIGISMLFPSKVTKKHHEFNEKEIDQDVIDDLALFSGVKSRNISKSFKGGSLVAIFGGINMDLRDACLLNEGAKLDVTAAFGGVNIIVPPEWKVVVKGIPIFGGWSNKTRGKNDVNSGAPVLTIHCFAAFGGVEIGNLDIYN